jgi:type I restriction enzyme M protein
MKFNVVVGEPDLPLDKWGADEAEKTGYKRFCRGVPPKTRANGHSSAKLGEAALKRKSRGGGGAPGVLSVAAPRAASTENDRGKPARCLLGLLHISSHNLYPGALLVFDRKREKGRE